MVARPGVSVCKDTLRTIYQTTKRNRIQTTQKRLQDKGNSIVEEIGGLCGVGPVWSWRGGNLRGSLDVRGWRRGMLQKNLRILGWEGSPKMLHSPYLSKTGITDFSGRLNNLEACCFCLPLPLKIVSPNDIYCQDNNGINL